MIHLAKTSVAALVQEAPALLRLGQKTIWLADDCIDMPWGDVETCERGSCWRGDVPTGVNLTAPHTSGLTFRWSVDIGGKDTEPPVDEMRCRDIARRLPSGPRAQFMEILKGISQGLAKESARARKRANELFALADLAIAITEAQP